MKWFFLFFLFFFCNNLFSQEDCDSNADGMIKCRHAEESTHKELQDILEWWAASPEQIRNAKCNNPSPITEEEMLSHLNSKKSNYKIDESFFGMDFKDEDPKLLNLLRTLTTFDDPWIRLQKKQDEKQMIFELPKGCDKVMCAAAHLFGEKNGMRILYALDKYNMNMSHVTLDDLAQWETKEIDLILEALDDLPPTLFPFDENRKLKHYKRGYGPSLSTIANAQIMIFSPWDDLPKEMKMSTIVHEIGHNIGSKFKLDESKEWLDISGWVEFDGKWKFTKEDNIISEYGKTNPFEDFTESTVAYRYNSENLKKRSPEKYEFIKKYVYQGLEFDTEDKCQLKKSKIADYIKDIPESEINENSFKSCEAEFGQIFNGQKASFKECLSNSKILKHVNEQIAKDSEVKNDEKYKNIILNSLKNIAPEVEVTQSEQDQVQTQITEKMMNHFKERFMAINGCDKQKEHGWMNILAFNEEIGNGNKYSNYISDEAINDFSYRICKTLPEKKWNVDCSDIIPFFKEFLPSSQKEKLNLNEIKNEKYCTF